MTAIPPQDAPRTQRGTRRAWSLALTAVLSLFFTAVVAATAFSLRTVFYDFDVREIVIRDRSKPQTQGDRFDQALLGKINAFSYVKSFDHVFETGAVKTTIRPLRMDRCEVRQGDFYKFAQWRRKHKGKRIAAPSQPRDWNYRSNNMQHAISGRLKAPANGVTYYDAYAYCKAAGGRLPFGDEWVAAATGQSGRLYPWGDEFNEFDWPYLDPLLNAAQQCGLHKESSTPEGLHNMGGVTSEWTQNRNNPIRPTIHGGNAYNQPRQIYSLNVLYRYAPPEYRSPYVGFRCVYEDRPKQAKKAQAQRNKGAKKKPKRRNKGAKKRPKQRKTPWKTKVDAVVLAPGDYETGVPRDARLPSLLVNLSRDKIHLLEQLFRNDAEQGDRKLFFMRHEVTREQYASFLNDPLVKLGLYADENEPKDHDYRPADWGEQMRRPELPAVNLDWWSAHAFAAWAGGRLPTSDEWIAAASAQGRNVYPWGNRFVAGNAIGGELRLTSAQLAGSGAGDVTADDVLDMGGNVSEWTQSTSVADGGYIIVVKGGNYLLPGEETARMDFRNAVPPNHASPAIGLRVVFDHRLTAWRLPWPDAEKDPREN